ncbi:hypothetical protein FDUTEX481_05658 [Tolypothrix sp. PCC 7601]|nr:hypothetical protein FDUTEX481_05658 [Tolypothrix sp. PCC 7601]
MRNFRWANLGLSNTESNNVGDTLIYSRVQGTAHWCQLQLKAI